MFLCAVTPDVSAAPEESVYDAGMEHDTTEDDVTLRFDLADVTFDLADVVSDDDTRPMRRKRRPRCALCGRRVWKKRGREFAKTDEEQSKAFQANLCVYWFHADYKPMRFPKWYYAHVANKGPYLML